MENNDKVMVNWEGDGLVSISLKAIREGSIIILCPKEKIPPEKS